MLEFQDYTDVDDLGAEAQEGERAIYAAIGRAVLHETMADDNLAGLSVEADAQIKELNLVAVVLISYAYPLAACHPTEWTQPPAARLEVTEAIMRCYIHISVKGRGISLPSISTVLDKNSL